jgi:SAM-dependent methyltransferase
MPINRSEEEPFGIQAPSTQYSSPNYLTPRRLSSIGYQYELAVNTRGQKFLDVGSGNGILSWLLQNNGTEVVSIDHNPGVKPNLVCVLPHLPIKSNAVDVSLCFQVLEHLPYKFLGPSMMELARVSKSNVVISVPDQTEVPSYKQQFAREIYQTFHLPLRWKPPSRRTDPEHFWEIGVDGIFVEDIIKISEMCQLTMIKHFRNTLFDYHHFFVFEKSADPTV